MTSQVEFFFDVGSPASYLAWTQLPKLCTDAGAELKLRPMLLGGVFQATGNASPVTVPAKGAYTFIDFARHAKRYGVTLIRNPHFPINTLMLMRAITGAQMHASEGAAVLIDAIGRLQEGALNDADSARQDSFEDGLLDCPHYTRSESAGTAGVPAVLLSGDHAAIARWRRQQSLGRTWLRRPDLLARMSLDEADRSLLASYRRDWLAALAQPSAAGDGD